MAGWNEEFPYAVQYPRTAKWYDNDWRVISSWCERTISGEWEYFNSEFRFSTERAKMLFMLKWCNDESILE